MIKIRRKKRDAVSESLGIQERTNEAYHDSLKKISGQILDIWEGFVTKTVKTDTEIVQTDRQNPKNKTHTYARRLPATVNGVSWVDSITVFVADSYEQEDAVLLGDIEVLDSMMVNGNRLDFNYHDHIITTVNKTTRKETHIPFKIKDEKIKECNILVYVAPSTSKQKLATMLDHELGHAKDVLDRHTSYKDMNADVTDFELLNTSQFNAFNSQDVWRELGDLSVSDGAARTFLEQCAPELVMKWFFSVVYYLNTSEIIQHRKNCYLEFKENKPRYEQSGAGRPQFEDEEIQMMRYSVEYETYKKISKILHLLVDYLPRDKKQDFAQLVIKEIVARDRGENRKQMMYNKTFADRNGRYNAASFDKFINFHIRRVDEYFLERCKRLWRALHTVSESMRPVKNALDVQYMKRLIAIAEEELLVD